MARRKRIQYPGLIYHVINRGNNRQAIFLEDEDYQLYLQVLYRYKIKFGFKLFAYCLMTNHVHLLIKVNEKASISKIMQCITNAHTRHYHFKYQTSGHVWQGRFHSPVVSSDDHLLTVMQYIEQNPLRAGMVKCTEDYKWSSYKLNIRNKETKLVDREDNTVYIESGIDQKQRIKAYKVQMKKSLDEKKLNDIRRSTLGDGYMSERFREQMEDMLPKKRKRGRPRKTELLVK